MGTRHSQTVIDKDGNLKLRQYGQWDGYPTGQGLDILKFLLSCDLDKYQDKLSKLRIMNAKDEKEYDKFMKSIGVKDGWMDMNQSEKFQEKYFFLSRDCGSRIHKLILRGKVPFVDFINEKEARGACEGFYTIDFQKRKFISEFHRTKKTFSLDNLPTIEEYLTQMKVKKKEIKDVLEREKELAKQPKTAKAIARALINELKKDGDKITEISKVYNHGDDSLANSYFKYDTQKHRYRRCNTSSVKASQKVIELLKEANLVA